MWDSVFLIKVTYWHDVCVQRFIALTLLYSVSLPTEEFCPDYIILFSGQRPDGVCGFWHVEAAATALKHSGGWQRPASLPFKSRKKRSQSETAALKRCDGSLRTAADCVRLRPDAAAAPPSLLLLKIPLWLFRRARPRQSGRTSKTKAPPFERRPRTSVAKHRFPLGAEIRDADEGKHWRFQMLLCLLVEHRLQHDVLSRVQWTANSEGKIPQTHYCSLLHHQGRLKWYHCWRILQIRRD